MSKTLDQYTDEVDYLVEELRERFDELDTNCQLALNSLENAHDWLVRAKEDGEEL